MNNLHIVTVATDIKYYLPYLKESCNNNGKKIEILGYGEKWKGFNWKYKKMIEYLNKLPQNDIVCFVDGYDVICTRNLNKLKNEFLRLKQKYNCKIIIAHDKQISIMKLASFYFSKCKNTEINSGTYIGYVKDLLYIISNVIKLNLKDNADDQILMTQYCKMNLNDFYIDIDNEIFLTLLYPLHELDNLVKINNNIVEYNNNYPFFIHAPGYGYLDNIIIKLGYRYDYNNKIKDELYKNIIKNKVLLYSKTLVYDNIFIIVLAIISIFIIFLYYFFIKNKYV